MPISNEKKVSGYIAELFGRHQSTYFTVLERVRALNGVPVGYFVTYLPERLGLPYHDKLYYSSLYEKLEEEYDIRIDSVKQSITAERSDKKTREMLELAIGDPVMVMKRQSHRLRNDEKPRRTLADGRIIVKIRLPRRHRE